jgi:hypothetical protein
MAVTLNASTSSGLISTADTSGVLQLQTAGTTALTIDTSQNVGIGATPSAWSSGRPTLEFGGSIQSTIAFNGSVINGGAIWTNAYYNGTNNIYKQTGPATLFATPNGTYQFNIAPSGTAGSTANFTQAMTLDASGYLLVGATSSSGVGASRLQVGGSGVTSQLLVKSSGAHTALYVTASDVYQTWASGGFLAWGNAPADGSSFTERARIDSSGNFAMNGGYFLTRSTAQSIGMFAGPTVTNDTARFEANGSTYSGLPNHAFMRGNPVVFTSITASEYARFDSSGNLLLGTTSAFSSGYLCTFNDANSKTPIAIKSSVSCANAYLIRFVNNSGTDVGAVVMNGSNNGVSFTSLSDYRLKENIHPMTGALAKVAALKPCTYTWKDNGVSSQGFIAHELQEVVPDAVVGEKDAVNEDGSIKPQGISTSNLVATLTAAIKEQQALIETLTQRITVLEGA